MERIGIILNPNSRQNRKCPGRAEALRRIVGDRGRVFATQSEAELRDVLLELFEWKVDCLVSTGGDGALNWLLNESREMSQRELPPAIPTNSGTIDFVARKVGVKGRAEDIVGRLMATLDRGEKPREILVDSLEVVGQKSDGSPFRRIGFAVAAGGIGNRFFDELYRHADYGAREILAIIAKAVLSHGASRLPLPFPSQITDYGNRVFRPTLARVTLDGERLPETSFGALHAGAFDIVLGPLRVFPLARDPGVLHFQAGEMLPQDIIRALPSLFRGEAIKSPRLHEVRAKEMIISVTGEELLSPVIDGEIFHDLSEIAIRSGSGVRILTV